MESNSFRNNCGFTLVELVTVMVILGIMSVVGGAKFFNNETFKETQYHQEILSAFRFAQKIAIASQNKVTICLGSNSYELYYSSGACSGTKVKHPAGSGKDSSGNNSLFYEHHDTSDISSTSDYTFSAAGNASATGNFTIGGHNITIEPVTGYVHE